MGEAQSPKNTASVASAFGLLWETHPVAVAATAIVVLAVGALAMQLLFYAIGSTGDEPPIRVRGGSFDLDVVSQRGGSSWTKDGATWISKNGKRNGKKLAVITLPPSDDNNCEKWLYTGNDDITVTFRDTSGISSVDYPVKLSVKDHDAGGGQTEQKTAIDPGTLSLASNGADDRSLSNTNKGYLYSVQFGKNLTCTYKDGDKAELVVFEK